MSKDTIYRQAAIDTVDEALTRVFVEHRDIAEKMINKIPSAQPERTCVNCGRTANNGGWYADGRTRCPIEEHYALPKDGYCHLWEKRNITDDDYPEAGRMTNIQAIDLLKGLEQSLDDYCELNDEGKTAFRMAITALELFGNTEQLPSAEPEPAIPLSWIEGKIKWLKSLGNPFNALTADQISSMVEDWKDEQDE